MPTCSSGGLIVIVKNCYFCPETLTIEEETDKDAGEHDWEPLDGLSPTCTEHGYGTIKCNLCLTASVGTYQSASGWSAYASRIFAIP